MKILFISPFSLNPEFSGAQVRINSILKELRKEHEVFSGIDLEVMDTDNEHVLGYIRLSDDQRVLILANFSESEQTISANILLLYGLSYKFTDLMSGENVPLGDVILNPYQFLCLMA